MLSVGRVVGFFLFAWLVCLAPAQARIKLNAVPVREKASVHLENPAATLIEEERTLALQKGRNEVDFSWKGVNIDPDSIRLAILSHPKEVRLISVSYPPAENALVWEVYSPFAGEERVRISYLLAKIDRLVTYKAIARKDETNLDLQSSLILRNFSGEDFENARLVLDYGADYEGRIRHEETLETNLFNRAGVPIRKVLTWDSGQEVWDPETEQQNVGVPVTYKLKNDAASGLGRFGLWGGKIRIFQEDGHGSHIYLGEDNLSYTPVGRDAAAYIGDSRDVVVTQRKLQETMINIKRNKGNAVVLYDSEERIGAEIENFKSQPLVLTVIEHIPGQWDLVKSSHPYTLEDAGTLKYEISLKPKEKQKLSLHYIRRNITNRVRSPYYTK